MKRPPWTAFGFLLGIALASCVPEEAGPIEDSVPLGTALPAYPAPGQPGTLQRALCSFALPEDVREGIEVECYYLTVAERWDAAADDSTQRLIQLAVAIFHPPDGASWPDPVVYLSGGPGGSALELMRYAWEAMTEPVFAAGRDLVVFDQRGVGLSRPALDCPEIDRLSRDLVDQSVEGQTLSREEAEQLLWDRLLDCRDRLQTLADLSAYHSSASADDVEALRRALGAERVNLWGGSYGTRLGLEVIRRHPEGLRSVVLDAVYPPDVDLYLEGPANFMRALDTLFAACAANEVCRSASPELRKTFFGLIEELNAQPVLRDFEDPFTGDLRPVWTTGDLILGLTFQLLYDSRMRYLLPQQIEAARQGDFRAFDLARASLMRLLSVSSRGMMFSVQCHEEIPFSSRQAFTAELQRFPETQSMYRVSILGELMYDLCPEWGAGVPDGSANEAVVSDVPTLLMAGEFDPITPPGWARHAAASLSRSYFYEYPGLGHGNVGAAPCPTEMFVAFLQDPERAPNSDCLVEMRQEAPVR